MTAFDDKLRAEAESWEPANAPRGLPTCPNCACHKPAPDVGKHHVRCTAKPILPVFTSCTIRNSMDGHVRHPINLAHFDPASTYAERLNGTTCPLFEARF